MIQIEIWDKKQGFTLPTGEEKTVEEIYKMYPKTKKLVTVLEFLSNGFVGGIDDMPTLRDIYKIDSSLTDEQALEKIIEIRNTPPQPYVDPVESKLDYLIMMS